MVSNLSYLPTIPETRSSFLIIFQTYKGILRRSAAANAGNIDSTAIVLIITFSLVFAVA